MDPTQNDPRVELAQDRTHMANYRTQLAMDRTTLAWIRTSLTFATFGFGMVGFFRSLPKDPSIPGLNPTHTDAIRFGTTLAIIGLVALILSSVIHLRSLRKLQRGEPPVLTMWPLSVTVAMLVSILGLLGLYGLFRR